MAKDIKKKPKQGWVVHKDTMKKLINMGFNKNEFIVSKPIRVKKDEAGGL